LFDPHGTQILLVCRRLPVTRRHTGIETVLGHQSFSRKAGEASHPARKPPAMHEQIRRTTGK
jgi:hypothetical protein